MKRLRTDNAITKEKTNGTSVTEGVCGTQEQTYGLISATELGWLNRNYVPVPMTPPILCRTVRDADWRGAACFTAPYHGNMPILQLTV